MLKTRPEPECAGSAPKCERGYWHDAPLETNSGLLQNLTGFILLNHPVHSVSGF
jgi:hypothetical protein